MIKEVRINARMSQSKLSEKSGISIRTLQAYEQGARNINKADLAILTSIAIALDCRITDLLTDPNLIDKCSKTLL